MSPELFPEGVHWVRSEIREELEVRLHPEEEALAREMGPARRAEFRSGRDCARRAMRALGVPDAPVLRAARRSPRWPEGVVGSITHTANFCAAAVARASDFAGLGLDAERLEPISVAALERIGGPEEIASLEGLDGHELRVWGSALFSVKETLYKAYFPLTDHFLGFRDAGIELRPETPERGSFRARLLAEDAPAAAGRREFEGRYAFAEGLVLSALALAR